MFCLLAGNYVFRRSARASAARAGRSTSSTSTSARSRRPSVAVGWSALVARFRRGASWRSRTSSSRSRSSVSGRCSPSIGSAAAAPGRLRVLRLVQRLQRLHRLGLLEPRRGPVQPRAGQRRCSRSWRRARRSARSWGPRRRGARRRRRHGQSPPDPGLSPAGRALLRPRARARPRMPRQNRRGAAPAATVREAPVRGDRLERPRSRCSRRRCWR